MDEMEIYLASPPDTVARASRYGPVSALAYRVGRDLRLYRTPFDFSRATLMDVDATSFQGYGPHEALVSALTRECRRMGYAGLSLDLPRPSPRLSAFAAALDESAAMQGLLLFLPERYARCASHASLLIPAQNTCGTYRGRLEHLVTVYGANRVALEAERVFTDFPLPCRSGIGNVVPRKDLPGISPGDVRFAPELCANYTSYMSGGKAHLLMWDDLCSLREKLRVAAELGIRRAFLYYPHVANVLDEFFIYS